MTTPNVQYWYKVDVTFKELATPANGNTFSFTNRPEIASTSSTVIPILKSIAGIGVKMGRIMPELGNAVVVLDCKPSSLGHDRRMLDIFDRSTCMNQSVVVYYAETPIETLSVSSWTEVWRGTVKDWRAKLDVEPTLEITLKNNVMEKRVITKLLDSEFLGTLPAISRGKALPLILGANVTVKPILIDALPYGPTYGYATTLHDEFVNGGIQELYAKNKEGYYCNITSPATESTACYSENATVNAGLFGSNFLVHRLQSLTDGYIITQGKITLTGTGNASWNAGDDSLEFVIYNSTPDGSAPFERVGVAEREKIDFETEFRDTLSPLTTFEIEFTFKEPVVVGGGEYYWFGFEDKGGESGTSDGIVVGINNTTNNQVEAVKGSSDAPWKIYSTSIDEWDFELYGVKLYDYPSPIGFALDDDGFGISHAILSQKSALTGISNPDLQKLDIIFEVNGILDDSSGTLTGSASSLLNDGKDFLKLLERSWNGSTWAAGNFNFTEYATSLATLSTYPSAGRTEGRRYVHEVLNDICDELGIRIAYISDTGGDVLAPWAWGTDKIPSATITDEQAKITRIESLGVDTVTNSVKVLYTKKLIAPYTNLANADLYQSTSSTESSEFLSTLFWDKDTNGLTASLATNSETLYSKRETLEIEYDWIKDSTTAEWQARRLLSVHAHPHVFVTLEVPFTLFYTLELLDIITIVHPDLPDHFGTTPDAHLPYYTEEVDINEGHYFKRAKPWRAQIEGKEIILDSNKAPTIRLTVRLLNNYPTDPT